MLSKIQTSADSYMGTQDGSNLSEAENLDTNGMVCDFKVIKDAVGEYVDSFDHALCINTEDPMYETLKNAYGERVIEFKATEPTTEVMAKAIFDECTTRLEQYRQTEGNRYSLRDQVSR